VTGESCICWEETSAVWWQEFSAVVLLLLRGLSDEVSLGLPEKERNMDDSDEGTTTSGSDWCPFFSMSISK
jgi:hypothetical protein